MGTGPARDEVLEEVCEWLADAIRDHRRAQTALEGLDFALCAFASQQAAEKALKALLRTLSRNAWGHELTVLLRSACDQLGEPIPDSLERYAEALAGHYTGARYPGVKSPQAPSRFYTHEMAQEALEQCDQVMSFARERLRRLLPGMDLT